ncbi:olfactory receptor 2D2-like [Bombina bombina]|uniref:olfactory receptor 2D2-like n=1 Tax=Bombina bombina TaxID=8345 RepID=UPI00235B12C4|nr:olfactory receptor 2D2-like [Bombina bombina]
MNKNETVVTEFILLGFSSNRIEQFAIFSVFLCIYLVILVGNLLIISVSIMDKSLQTPMYFFLINLSFIDICFSSTVVPRMLRDLLSAKKTILFQECAAQMYISLSSGVAECILLATMAYDRYVAICFPLHYMSIINRSACIRIVAGSWICGFLLSISHVVLTMNVNFCGNNQIKHFVCEVPEVLALACGDVSVIELVIFLAGVLVLMIPVTFIIISYIRIISAIIKITTSAGKKKALSTCGSHIMVVTLFYGSAMAVYMKPKSKSSDSDIMITVCYVILTPMLNPLIYSLRNKEFRTALQKARNLKILYL